VGRGAYRRLGNAVALGVAIGVVVAAAACSEIERHRVLDVVFDGVPPYVPPEDRARLQAAREISERDQQDARSMAGRLRRRREGKKLRRFTHGPFAAQECTRCHDFGAASGFRAGTAGAASGASLKDLAEAGRLRMPVVELCTHCHDDFSPQHPANTGYGLHGPVAMGWCVMCHEPHSSPYAKLLTAYPTARLCGRCHERADLVEFTPEHRPGSPAEAYPANGDDHTKTEVVRVVRDCTRCHDPHRGRDGDPFLLKPERLASHRH